jgi:TRIAD3 protein (E3 ubiquitin-protein ligase RNF216)
MSRYVARILEIVPDVDPEHCVSLVTDHQALGEATIERVLHILFEDSNYPRMKKNGIDKGKRKADGSGEVNGRPNKIAKGSGNAKEKNADELFMSIERPFTGGINYHDLALVRLS